MMAMSWEAARRGMIITIAMVAALLALAFARFRADTGTAIDQWTLNWVLSHRSSGLTTAAVAVTDVGSPPVVIGLAVGIGLLLWWQLSTAWAAVIVIGAVGAAGGVSTSMKVLVGAVRPVAAVQLLPETDGAFPSGHVTATLTLLGLTAALVWAKLAGAARTALIATVAGAVVTVSASRLYLGVHWVTDIVGGLLLGCASITLGYNVFQGINCSHTWSERLRVGPDSVANAPVTGVA